MDKSNPQSASPSGNDAAPPVGQSICCGAKLINVDTGIVGMVLICSACDQPTERKPDPRAEKKQAFHEAFAKRKKPKKKTAVELLHEEAMEAEAVQRQLRAQFLARQRPQCTVCGHAVISTTAGASACDHHTAN